MFDDQHTDRFVAAIVVVALVVVGTIALFALGDECRATSCPNGGRAVLVERVDSPVPACVCTP